MNITQDIAEKIGGKEKDFILKNESIQFYANSNTETYQWIDSSSQDTSDVWENEDYETRTEFINAMREKFKQ